jgi:glycosyltransferase involved in cell wall biosynthesis
MTALSVVIITFNEEKNIGRCIDSVKNIADEIIVLDSNSTDKTVHIATEKGATVYTQAFPGYIEQKNKALSLAKNNCVLSLDADEAIDLVLNNSIAEVKKTGFSSSYSMNRCTNYLGRFIRHGTWYPDKKIRLVDKTVAKWGGYNPHDMIELKNPENVKHLKGDILHFSYNSIEEHISQNNKFSSIAAEALYKKNKKTNFFKIFLNPLWAFLNYYFIRLGLLDGFYGFIIAINVAHLTFLKHIKLYQLQNKHD